MLPPWRSLLPASLLAWLAYGSTGALAILLAGPPGYASPLYPPAGIALAALLVYGRAVLPGIWLASFSINAVLGAARAPFGLDSFALAVVLATGAALQAGVGAWLVRRFMARPVVLSAPREIVLFGLLGGVLACVLSASVATPALLASGRLGSDVWLANWLTWWFGDTLGVIIGAPLALTLIGQPRADWRPRLRTMGLPMLLAVALISTGLLEFGRLDRERLQSAFDRDVDRLAGDAQARLATPLHALQALHSAARARQQLDADSLQQAAGWWLRQPLQLLAMGVSERVPLPAVPAFEAAARAQGLEGYHVTDRDGGRARTADNEVVALRLLTPLPGNEALLGANTLANPPLRAALLAARDSGEPAASDAFTVARVAGAPLGLVLYQALYRGESTTVAARRQQFRGALFVLVRIDQAMAGLVGSDRPHLSWCLVDPTPGARLARLAGPPGCDTGLASAGRRWLTAERELTLGGRTVQLRVGAPVAQVPGHQREAAWMLSLAGLAAAALLSVLLLTVTGHTRRTELAVQQGTAALRREIEERTQAEAALRDSESRLRSILDHVPLGVIFLDPQGRIIDGNPRLAEMAGRSVDALRGVSVVELVHPDEEPRICQLRRDLLAGAASATLDSLRLRAGPWALDGELRVRVSTSALREPVPNGGTGRVLRLVSVLEDITEHLRLQESERALHRAEAANRAKSDFLSRMSHELRTPLNAMIGFAQLLGLDREPELVGHQRDWTQQIQRAGWHLLDMINETLDLARIESGAVHLTLEPVALAPLAGACQAMVASAAAQRGIRIAEAVAADAGAVVADLTRLKQVLTNLLSNAVKYNREGGSVTLRTRRLGTDVRGSDGGAASSPVAATGLVEISVEDSGLGMSPQQLASLFQPYNRLGRENSGIEGTGIGLVISRRLAELMGGTLDATSTAGQGSTFRLRLPAAARAEAPLPRNTDTAPAPYQQRLVHYVEDNEINIEVMRGIFAQRPQIRLQVSTLGLDGLSAIRAERPDLVLLDMQLPDISGLELLRHLKQNDLAADIPVVVVSADATAPHMERALTSGALHYVTKPLDVARFLSLVDGILESVETRWAL